MQIVEALSEMREKRSALASTVGLVPTMGFLHEGHLSLVRAARRKCTSVVATIFVNPAQFGPSEDFKTYPRDLQRDLALLEKEEVDLVWVPTVDILYPPGYQTWVTVEEVTARLEGEKRPHHFKGVTTIVAKLLNVVCPHTLFLGQKDAQQVCTLRRMIEDLNYPTELFVGPIQREPDGLALSSRNAYLSPKERQAATLLYASLSRADRAFRNGEKDAHRLRTIVSETLQGEPLVSLQYVSCADPVTLNELEETVKTGALLSLAAYVGKVRLIDNQFLGENE